ncbi:TetR/AcrR family transcriptional regulator [Labrenzia sp. VG12]|uniref:TetR/AcrR family transcriptional regulator n=1 Tax=Labrenzia sp. VG12 TaxID=2021862 RepID=UPI000B8C3E53|nr:TetR/AcrR family transcriptional regulator [Labrenzia sp. VG12]ASP35480.1 TetR family transcriptional regulator [Labrenzia sp. VG12]
MGNEKASEILLVARRVMMERGYNGFSFRDIAAEVGIKSASIHYHYPTKGDLAEAAAKDYREWCLTALADLSAPDAPGLLAAYGNLFVAMLKDKGSVCLGGVLASDAATLPPSINAEVEKFFLGHHEWLSAVLQTGQQNGEIRPDLDPIAFAKTFVSSMEGAMMVSRATGNPNHLSETIDQLIHLARPLSR